MTRQLVFLTHAEVVIDPQVPVPDWPLNDLGRERHAAFARSEIAKGITAVYSSDEQKARDGAEIFCQMHGMTPKSVKALGENDRSATGYLAQSEFDTVVDAFFAQPDASVRGWERARAAQARIVSAVQTIADLDDTDGDILIVAHGGVGTLLRCHLMGLSIARSVDQPLGGGCYFITDVALVQKPANDWVRI